MIQGFVNTYAKIRIDPKIEAKMIGELRKTGQPFRSVSRTEYYISKKQCESLKKANIPYKTL
jgi:hypothetical protein